MSEQFQILNLSFDLHHDVKVLDPLSVEYLDGDLVPGLLVERNFNLAKGSDPQCLPQDVRSYLDLTASAVTVRSLSEPCTTIPHSDN